ncbi:MAG: hypothetical protein HHAS10_09910 [Candidatus Altimarinota bacterium]
MNFRAILYTLAGLIGIFIILFSWSAYQYYEIVHADDPIHPKIEATIGKSKIVRGDYTYELNETETYKLENNDIIETGKESRATITWPDKSITRLGPATRIVIEKMYASTGYENIAISYKIEHGKVWNTVIRSLIGDSYFEVELPREGVVAGVRGTIFEINLENKYIHAVNHNTSLTQKNQTINLLPGEVVDSENILLKKGKEWLDTRWSEWNEASDAVYQSIQKLNLDARFESLTKDIGKINFSNLTRTVLENVGGFEDLSIAELIKSNQLDELKKISTNSLLSYYQKLGNLNNNESREKLRKALLDLEDESIANIRESLQIQEIWESIDTGKLTEGTKKYLESKGVNTNEFATKFMSGASADITGFKEFLSGGFNRVLNQ